MYPYPVNSSGAKSASAQITSRSSLLAGIDMITPATGQAILTLYDSNSNSATGTVIAEMEVDAGMPSCNHEYMNLVHANNGIYASLVDPSGTATYIIRFALA